MAKYLDRVHLDNHFHRRTNLEERELNKKKGVDKHSKEKMRADEEKAIHVKIEEDNIMLIISKKVDHPKNKKSKVGIPDSSQRRNIRRRG
ncbi:hypothetical protein RDI58_027277 [Solanum bulbocastanum]|uniref:Uncharacterized protein n=1 Tax=Solanum bulbocastanum TaxID=147425 RepID=A0AAN8Y220_SOLBU